MASYTYAYRGGLLENRHRVFIAIVEPQGRLLAHSGPPGWVAPLRSTAKPFQALALYLSGAVGRFGLTPAEVALSCASHDGTPAHIALAAQYLEKIGLGPEHLACGAHLPLDPEARQALHRSGEAASPLHNNCSGKHAGMLAAALALNASPHGYEKPEHPVQQLILQTLRELSGQPQIPQAVDGCSVPTFALPLASTARMFALLAHPGAAPRQYREGLKGVFAAMQQHPEWVAGPRSMDTVLMRRVPGLVAKRGADGYYGMALQNSRWGPIGIALKVESGSNEAREPMVVRLLEELGVLSPEEELPWRRPALKNVRGLEVGHLEAHLELRWTDRAA
ncbi:MAG: asparaginase [Meiothermus sp.]|uniref:asparaginase n=1 Tax=Meiothermus sp. TaxID=1955249 RepID=UPI0025DA9AE8|nr:asparaginase [Meiothermus sp.]MCS7193976.1 asparaginase [Meiothermus sp.]MDW8090738.1 asparaginase [Meiothermus sp.]MDW8480836.1 asparaginase [Meiothermus sp.]